jgi:hypothetical protein
MRTARAMAMVPTTAMAQSSTASRGTVLPRARARSDKPSHTENETREKREPDGVAQQIARRKWTKFRHLLIHIEVARVSPHFQDVKPGKAPRGRARIHIRIDRESEGQTRCGDEGVPSQVSRRGNRQVLAAIAGAIEELERKDARAVKQQERDSAVIT